MPPKLLLIRHAQALHNVANDWSFHDPKLSELGEQQSRELQTSLQASKIAHEVQLIIVSPMRRTLQTATIGLDFLIRAGIPIIGDANWQENADKPCDTGSPLSVMQKEFPTVDLSNVDPTFDDKTTDLANNPYAFTRKAILARGQTCLKELYARPESVIAIVTHSGFLRTAVCNRAFFNADWRVFTFDEEEMARLREKGEDRFVLKEDEETESRGGGMGRSEKGVFGIVEGDFPPDDEEEVVKGLGEATGQKPGV